MWSTTHLELDFEMQQLKELQFPDKRFNIKAVIIMMPLPEQLEGWLPPQVLAQCYQACPQGLTVGPQSPCPLFN